MIRGPLALVQQPKGPLWVCASAQPCRPRQRSAYHPEPTPGAGTNRQISSTLMSAFASSRQVNSWLSFKHLLQALQGKAGGTTVMTTVDHTLMRGLEPHDR